MKTYTACAKVILLGEHGVVYGRPALAVGMPNGASAVAKAASHGAIALALAGSKIVSAADRDPSDLSRALRALASALPGSSASGAVVEAEVHVPAGGGLGSSAALGVAVARALGAFHCGRELTLAETLNAAHAWEEIFHGQPSGIDHTVAAMGGAGTFARGQGFHPVTVGGAFRLVIADTGERAATRAMVASVARIHQRRRELVEKTFDAMAALVRNGAMALEAGDARGLGQLMDLNQNLLASLLVSTERTERLCRVAREAGALGAKLTGGGGGGCVVALARDDGASIRAALEADGASAFVVDVGG